MSKYQLLLRRVEEVERRLALIEGLTHGRANADKEDGADQEEGVTFTSVARFKYQGEAAIWGTPHSRPAAVTRATRFKQ